jgi:hypothetical protein
MGYTINPIKDPIRVYGRAPTKAEIADNRRCWNYVLEKQVYGTLTTIPSIDANGQPTTKQVWLRAQGHW